MTAYDYDLFVIGVGSGGVRAARMSAQYGARVATAEEKFMGGTCVNVGCIPKKLFVYASHYHEDFNESAGYGWQSEPASFNWQTLVDSREAYIKRIHTSYGNGFKNNGVTLPTAPGLGVDIDEDKLAYYQRK